jgi:hypothetical protein
MGVGRPNNGYGVFGLIGGFAVGNGTYSGSSNPHGFPGL